METIEILLVKSELGAGTRGSSLGPEAMILASANTNNNLFAAYPYEELPHQNIRLLVPSPYPFAKQLDGIQQIFASNVVGIQQRLNRGVFPIILAADHSNAASSLAAIKSAHPDQRVGVIWIDAHADLHSPFTTPSGNVHGMPLALSTGIDNQSNSLNPVDEETIKIWNNLKSFVQPSPWVHPEDIVFVGLRDVEPEEQAVITRFNIKDYPVALLRSKGPSALGKEILEDLSKCDLVYISFDVDSMDPEDVSYGTGTPVPGGILHKEALELLQTLCASPKIACLEIAEVNPLLDNKKNRMAETAFSILAELVGVIENRK